MPENWCKFRKELKIFSTLPFVFGKLARITQIIVWNIFRIFFRFFLIFLISGHIHKHYIKQKQRVSLFSQHLIIYYSVRKDITSSFWNIFFYIYVWNLNDFHIFPCQLFKLCRSLQNSLIRFTYRLLI